MIYLFDLDDTLYPKSCGLQAEIRRRVVEFACRYLDLSLEETQKLRLKGLPVHGTTLRWLQQEHQFSDIEEYLDYVHPKNLDPFFKTDDSFVRLFQKLNVPFAVFTNSPREHADRVLKQLGIAHFSKYLFDIRFLDFKGKPHNSAYRKVCNALDTAPEELVLFDDSLLNVQSFIKFGGSAVLVDEDQKYNGSLLSITDIPGYLASLSF